MAWFEKQVYGQKSEKTEVVMEAGEPLSFFDEAETEADITPQSVKTIEVKSHSRKIKRTHDEIFKDLPIEEVVHTVDNKTCDKCGSEMVVIGTEKIRDELVYVPARMFLRRHVAEVIKCTACGMDESRDADLPDIEKCNIRHADVPSPHGFITASVRRSFSRILHTRSIVKACRCIDLRRILMRWV